MSDVAKGKASAPSGVPVPLEDTGQHRSSRGSRNLISFPIPSTSGRPIKGGSKNEIELRCVSELEGVCQAWTATGAKDDNAETESITVVP